jgi:hypothetical protein
LNSMQMGFAFGIRIIGNRPFKEHMRPLLLTVASSAETWRME